MKVLLINPNYREIYSYGGAKELTPLFPPLGLAHIAAVLRKNDIDVKILEANINNLNHEQIKKEINNYGPNFIGITATTCLIEEANEIAKLCPDNTTIIVGGIHASSLPVETLEQFPDIDLVVIGEGEYTMLDIARLKPLYKIAGIYYRKNNKIFKNEPRPLIKNLDELPFPARDLLPMGKYWSVGIKKYPFATIMTSRGCPYNCNFCVNYKVLGKKFRYRSPENVLEEIDELVNKYHIKELSILDDNFSLLPNRVEKICDGLIERRYNLIWKTSNGIRADSITEPLIQKMKKAGCYLLAFGVESGNPEILKVIQKGETLDQIKNAVMLCKKYRIKTEAFFMIGNENETEGTMQDTINFAKELDIDIAQFQVFIPLPGSSYYEKIKQNGKLFAKSWNDYNAFNEPVFEYQGLTRELMSKMQKRAYKEYYFRPKMIIKRLLEIRSFRQFNAYFGAGLSVIKKS